MSMRKKEFRLLLTILLVLLGVQVKAEDHLSIQSAEITAGAEFTLSIELTNDLTYKAFQMDIVLPEGITPFKTNKGKFVITKDADRMEDTDHSISTNYLADSNTLKLVCTSMGGDEFYGNSGSLFTVKLQAAANIKGGAHQVTLTGIKFTDANNVGHDFADATATFTVPGGSEPEPTVDLYKLTWVVDGQSTVTELESGAAITKPTDPVKEGYTFAGWTPEVAATMPAEDVTYIAQWSINKYKVTWVVDGQSTETEVEYGAAITKPADPVKEGYKFTGWTPTVASVMPAEDVTYTAVFEQIVVGGDRVSIESAEITAGAEFTLSIELTNELTYKAFQMDIVLPEGITPYKNNKGKFVITKDADRMEDTDHSISSNYLADSNTLKLVCTSMAGDEFYGNSGSLFTVKLQAAAGLNPGDYEVKLAGVKFTDVDNQGHEFADATATFTVPEYEPTVDIYTYKFISDGVVLASGELTSGEALTAPVAPEKTGYTFAGWSPEFTGTMPFGNVTYKAVYTPNAYTVTWVIDGEEMQQSVNCDAEIIAPDAPMKEGYTFAGWSPVVPITMPAEDMTFTAQFTVNKYWVTFIAEGVEVSKRQLDYGSAFEAPNAPAVPGMRFLYWAPEVAATVPAYDVTYKAVYEEAILDVVSIPNLNAVAGETFTLPVSLTNLDVFVGFQMDIVLPEGIAPVVNNNGKIAIKKTDRLEDSHSFSYNYIAASNTVKMVCTSLQAEDINGYEGELFSIDLRAADDMQTGDYDVALAGVKFTTSSSAIGGARGFALENAKGIISVAKIVKECSYQFVADGVILATGNLMPGDTLAAPSDPSKAGYTFKGWTPGFTGIMPSYNVVYQAVFVPNLYTATWVIDGREIVHYINCDAKIEMPENPSKVGYTFVGWTPEVAEIMPAENVTYTAQWAVNQYWVTFMAEGIEVSKTAMDFGSKIFAPDAPVIPGKVFLNWSPAVDATVPAYDVTYEAVYEQAVLDTISVPNMNAVAGETFSLPVSLTNVDVFVGFQMDINLPQGITPVFNSKGKIVFTKSDRLESSHSFSYNYVQESNTIKLVCTSMESDEIFGNNGELFSINLNVAEEMTEGDYEVSLTNVKFTTGSSAVGGAQGYPLADAFAVVTVVKVLKECSYQFVAEGEVLAAGETLPGEPLTAPSDPVKAGYTFKGWTPAFTGTMPGYNVVYQAVFAPNAYKATWLVDGIQYYTANINCDAKVVSPKNPTKVGYTFAGWTPEVPATMPAEDITFTAQWTVNQYWLTFMAEGVEVSKVEQDFGTEIVAPEAPAIPGKNFLYWTPEIPATVPANNMTFKAVYEEVILDTISVQNVTVNTGETFSLPVSLTNEDVFVGFQMDINLPQGITPALNSKGKLVITKSERLDESHSFSYNYIEWSNTIKLVCTSMAGEEISGNSGELFAINLQAAEDMTAGDYTVMLTGVKFTTSSETVGGSRGLVLADAKAIVTVSDAGRIEALQAQLTELISTLNGLMESKMTNWVRTELNDAIENYKNAADVNTLQEGIEELTWMIEWAQASVNNYADLATRLEQLHGMLEDNGVRDPQILKDAQAYYNDILAQWNAEELDEEGIWQATEMISYYINQLNKVALTINVEEAGTLRELILQQVADYSSIIGLTVTGNINDEDLTVFSEMRNNLVTLNLEETNLTNINGWLLTDMYVLKTLVLPKNLVTLSDYAFQNCTVLENISFPATLKTIGNYAFAYCYALTKVEIPEGVEYLGYCSFAYCSGLQEVILPSTLNYCDRAFWYSNQITKITCKAVVPPSTYGQLMRGNESLCTLEVPVISVQTYQNTSYWNYFNIVGGSYYGDNMVLTSDITLNANDSVLAAMKPSITLTKTNNDDWSNSYAALYVEGSNTLSLNNFEMFYDPYMAFRTRTLGYDNRYSAILINDAPMRADNVSAKLRLNAYQWFFVSMPFDAKVSNITSDRDVPYVIYKYDGKRRADGDMENTWVKMTADSTLRAGVGYIWQAASYYDENYGDRYDITFTLKAQNNSNKINIFRTGNAEVQLTEYVSEFPHNRSWNLVGNPFAAYFNSRAMDITAPFTVWNVENQNYEAFSPIDDSYIFAPGEAFFIQRPADQATIEFLAAGRQNSCYKNNEVFFNNSRQSEMTAKRSVFNLMLQQDNKTLDRTRIVINKQAELGYESDKDAAKFEAMTKVSQIYTIVDGQHYAINERPIGNGEMVLGAEFAMKGTYTLILETSAEEKVYLIDRLTGAEVLMTEDGYTFEAEAGIANGRFLVRVDSDEVTGIRSIDNSESEDAYYDLRGVRVQKPHKGLYINNGKKTVVK